MNKVFIKSSGIAVAMALCTLATSSMAQDSRSSTTDSSSYGTARSSSGQPVTSGNMDERSWGNQPRTQFRDDQRVRGARGPIRSDDPRYRSDLSTTDSGRTSPGLAGFIMWRETNSDTP